MSGVDVAALVGMLPEGTVLTDPERLDRYTRDVTGRFSGRPAAVVRPRTVEDVAATLRACNDARTGVVPRGGNTGLVGGAVAAGDEIVLSLERLTRIEDVDATARTLVAGAGATLEAVREHARGGGLDFPLDFAARGSATIGGMVATDAGGSLVLRHGTMRDLVAGLQVVLADGTIVDHLHRPGKDGSGFDVTRLMCGSEGTLGVVTAARLKLVPRPEQRAAALVALGTLDDAVTAAARLRVEVASLEALDFFLAGGLELVREHAGLPPPFPAEHGAFLVASCAGDSDPTEELAAALARCDRVRDSALAQSAAGRERLWSYRELHNEAINAAGIPHKLDVAVAPRLVPELVELVERRLATDWPEARGVYYGHLAEGNVHVNVLGAAAEDEGLDGAVLRIVAGLGGSISAEHGIGAAKARWLHLARTEEEIAAMRAVKRALDPRGILNPGKLLPPNSSDPY